MADSVFQAVREGWEFFQDSFWYGPKPTLETVFDVSLVGGRTEMDRAGTEGAPS
jgi:hypothetical protein